MTWAPAAIRTAVAECLTGTIGSTRTVTSGKFASGVWDGQPEQTAKALAVQTSTARHRFDVELGALRNHAATSIATIGNRRIAEVDVDVRVTSNVATVAQATQRATDLATIAADLEMAVMALSYPSNLTQTSTSVATGIIGGCLLGPSGASIPIIERLSENWGAQLVLSYIRARAILNLSV